MLRIAICDDEPSVLEKYALAIRQIGNSRDIPLTIQFFDDGDKLLFYLSDNPNGVDILFLDIIMVHSNGVEIAKKLRALGCHAEILFLTHSSEHIFDAFEVSASHYLLKSSLTHSKFEDTFVKAAIAAGKKKNDAFIFESGGMIYTIPLGSITHFEVRKRIIIIHQIDGFSQEFYGTLDQIELRLKDKNFARIHRSFIVNIPHIIRFSKLSLTLTDGCVLTIGPTYQRALESLFSQFLSAGLVETFSPHRLG